MTIEYAILKSLNLVIIYNTGKVDDEDVRKFMTKIAAEEDFSSEFNQFSDARFIEENLVTQGGLQYAANASPFSNKSKNAIVVKRDIEKGRANQFGAYSSDSSDEYVVVTEIEQAIQWLNYVDDEKDQIIKVIEDYHDSKK